MALEAPEPTVSAGRVCGKTRVQSVKHTLQEIASSAPTLFLDPPELVSATAFVTNPDLRQKHQPYNSPWLPYRSRHQLYEN